MTSKIAKFHCSIRKRAWWPRFYMLTFLYHGPPFVPHLNCWYLLKVLTTSIGQEEKFSKHTLPKYFAEYYWLTIIKIGSRLKIEKKLESFFLSQSCCCCCTFQYFSLEFRTEAKSGFQIERGGDSISVTRLKYFWTVLATTFLTKVA